MALQQDPASPSEAWPFLNVEPASTWRPGQKPRARKSVSHTISGAVSMLRSAARREEFDAPDLTRLAEVRAQLAEVEQLAVDNLRAQGASWADIGDALGVSRQAAQMRYGR